MRRALVLVCAVLLAGCSGTSTDASPSLGRLTDPDTVVTFPRLFQADRLVEAQVLLARGDQAVVTSARLESPLYADAPSRDAKVTLYSDWTNRVRMPLGTPVCPAPAGESEVVLTLDVGGASHVETLHADDTVLRQINAADCAQQAVLAQATPSFGPVAAESGDSLTTTLVLTRGSGTSPVSLDRITGNIIFAITVGPGAATRLGPQDTALAIPLTITADRCDPHAFAESKKTFVFPVHLLIDGQPGYVEFTPDADFRAALQRIFDACGQHQREGSG